MDPTEDQNGLTPEEFPEASPCRLKGQDGGEIVAFQVELLFPPVADAPQRLTRAISLALRAASRGDDSGQCEVSPRPNLSSSEEGSPSDPPCPEPALKKPGRQRHKN